jgi:hypothetical protein
MYADCWQRCPRLKAAFETGPDGPAVHLGTIVERCPDSAQWVVIRVKSDHVIRKRVAVTHAGHVLKMNVPSDPFARYNRVGAFIKHRSDFAKFVGGKLNEYITGLIPPSLPDWSINVNLDRHLSPSPFA